MITIEILFAKYIYIYRNENLYTEESIKLTILPPESGRGVKEEREGGKTPRRSLMKIVYTVNGDLQPLEN